MRYFVVMGVSGCGKTTVGEGLAARCGIDFIDGDSLHPEANIAKMSSGIPLDDDDRKPWLEDIGSTFAKSQHPLVIGCSALKRTYRDLIRSKAGAPVCFVHLAAPKEVLAARVSNRPGHFMPASLLDSQFAALEELEADEAGVVIDISVSVQEVIDEAVRVVSVKLDKV